LFPIFSIICNSDSFCFNKVGITCSEKYASHPIYGKFFGFFDDETGFIDIDIDNVEEPLNCVIVLPPGHKFNILNLDIIPNLDNFIALNGRHGALIN
jgi:hypothetical protein